VSEISIETINTHYFDYLSLFGSCMDICFDSIDNPLASKNQFVLEVTQSFCTFDYIDQSLSTRLVMTFNKYIWILYTNHSHDNLLSKNY
jgi:hypothetical protein